MEPYDSTIARLEKDLLRRREKLDKKPTRWNLIQYNRTATLLEQWKKAEQKSQPIDITIHGDTCEMTGCENETLKKEDINMNTDPKTPQDENSAENSTEETTAQEPANDQAPPQSEAASETDVD